MLPGHGVGPPSLPRPSTHMASVLEARRPHVLLMVALQARKRCCSVCSVGSSQGGGGLAPCARVPWAAALVAASHTLVDAGGALWRQGCGLWARLAGWAMLWVAGVCRPSDSCLELKRPHQNRAPTAPTPTPRLWRSRRAQSRFVGLRGRRITATQSHPTHCQQCVHTKRRLHGSWTVEWEVGTGTIGTSVENGVECTPRMP